MLESWKLKLKDPKLAFKSIYGKVRLEDVRALGINKKLNPDDRTRFKVMAEDMRNGTKPNADLLYRRNHKSVRFINFEER